ncbi:MAG: ABC transporter ATP-binding protein [Calditrichaeota bacterium]|nr:ABC transporter ATP-binding protein [Calditrichota bacterium]HQU71085.1 ABC transporter ATP-binding protein [Calditrichia bacterium]
MNITIQDLHKIYPGGKAALSGVDLEIENGLFGLLGPNGAGKTTLMRILVTLMEPSRGAVNIDGLDLNRDRGRIRAITGYLPQGFSTFPKLKTWEFLDYSANLAGLKGRQRSELVDKLLEQVGLFEVRDRLANKLSGGMKRRLGIAQALAGDPRILIVDEPTTGLDPEERIRFRNILSDMARGERIIILSTHIVGDISSTCKDMALLVSGRVGFKGAPAAFIEKARGFTFQITANDQELVKLKEQYPVIATLPGEKGWEVELVAEKAPGPGAREIAPSLEHAYVYFMEFLANAA